LNDEILTGSTKVANVDTTVAATHKNFKWNTELAAQ
jgi:hypothetical protein